MVKQEVPTSIEQNRFFVLRPSVGPPLFSVINKRGMLAKLGMMIMMVMMQREMPCATEQA